MGTGRKHLIHPDAGVGGAAGLKPHQASLGFQREVVSQQRSQVGASEDNVAPGQERVKRRDAQLRGDGLEGLDREQSH